jgi:site-specific DNA recombinase
MYLRTLSPKYVCRSCKNKISPTDLEDIFHGQLENFLFSDTEIQNHLNHEVLMLKDKEVLLESRKKEYQKLKQKVADILELYHEGELSKQAFREHYGPVQVKQEQVEQSMMELQGEVDALKMQSLGNSQVLHDAQNLHRMWKRFTKEEKKGIIEAITESIIVGKEDIEINLCYLPAITEAVTAGEENTESNKTVVCKTGIQPTVKTLQHSNTTTWLRC